MPSVKPLDVALVTETAQRFAHVFTIEVMARNRRSGQRGGRGIAQLPHRACQLHLIAGPDSFQPVGGWLKYMRPQRPHAGKDCGTNNETLRQ